MVNGAALVTLVGDQAVLTIEEKEEEMLHRLVADLGAAVFDYFLPRGEDWPHPDLFADQAASGLEGSLDDSCRGRPDTG